jgi:hypothetical protein
MLGHKQVINDGPIYPTSLQEMIILDWPIIMNSLGGKI